MKKNLLLCTLAIAVAIAAAVTACLSIPAKTVTFTASNVGTQAMHSVVVHITGNSYPIGDLAPGASTSVVPTPTADTHIELSLNGHPRLTVDCYFSGGYTGSVSANVTADKVVSVENATVFRAY